MAVFGLNFTYYVKGSLHGPLLLNDLSAAFERAGDAFGRFGEFVFPRVIPVLEKEVGGQFDAEGHGPNRGKWRPLDPVYAKRKAKLYPGRKILEATGRMKKALTDGNSGGALRHYSRTELRFGTAGVTHASFHQTGAKYAHWDGSRSRDLIDRPVFDFTREFATDLEKASLSAARAVVKAARVEQFASGPLTTGSTEVAP